MNNKQYNTIRKNLSKFVKENFKNLDDVSMVEMVSDVFGFLWKKTTQVKWCFILTFIPMETWTKWRMRTLDIKEKPIQSFT